MTYYRINKEGGEYCVWYRNSQDKYPFISSLYNTGSNRNVTAWKTEKGAHAHINKKFPDWVYETETEYRTRKELYKRKQT